MSPSLPAGLTLLLVLFAGPAAAQQVTDLSDTPLKPHDKAELDRREALSLYGLAAQHEQQSRLPDALRVYEQALKLDPESAAIRRALVTLYLALDRQEEALAACKRIVAIDAEDFDTWLTYGRQLKLLDREAEARKAFASAALCKGLPEHPEAHLNVLFELGVLHHKAKAYREAEAAFRQVVAILERPSATLEQGNMSREELSGQVADTYERIGTICLEAKQVERAVEAFRAAQRSDPARGPRLSYNLAEVMVSLKRDEDALKYLDQYLVRQPEKIDGYELKLKLLHRLGRSKEALTALEQHARDDQYNNALKLLLAREYQNAGKRADAEKIYAKMLVTPSVEVYRGLFGLYRAEGAVGTRKLFERLNEAVSKAMPDDRKQVADADQAAHARAMLAVLRADRELVKTLLPLASEGILKGKFVAYRTRVFLAALAERTEQLDVAETLYRSCLDGDGRIRDFGERKQAEAEVYGGLLRVLNQGRKYEELVIVCKQGLEFADAGNRVLFHLDMALAQLGLGHGKEAIEAANAAVDAASDKERLACRRSRAWMLSQLDRVKEAETECLELLKEYKGDDEIRSIRLALASIYSEAKQHEKSEEQLLMVLDVDPLDAHALNDLGYQWADRNHKLAEAERMIRKAIELDRQQRGNKDALGLEVERDNAAYVDSLGWVLYRRGRFKEASVELEKATQLPDGGRDPVVWDHLGDAYRSLKDKKKAAEAYRKALRLFEERHRVRREERAREIETKLKRL